MEVAAWGHRPHPENAYLCKINPDDLSDYYIDPQNPDAFHSPEEVDAYCREVERVAAKIDDETYHRLYTDLFLPPLSQR